MRGLSLAMACLCLAACADSPAPLVHGKALGPCLVLFQQDGPAWYAVMQRDPSPTYASGPFVAEFWVFPRGGKQTIRMVAQATEDKVLIPGPDVFNPGLSSCQSYEPLTQATP